MKTIRIFLVSFFLLSTGLLFAQTDESAVPTRPLNGLHFNFLGDGSILSFNYERLFIANPNLMIAAKVGVGFNKSFNICLFGGCSPAETYLTTAHHITANIGQGKHFFECGLGGTYITSTKGDYIPYPIVGYRLSSPEKSKATFRIFAQIPMTNFDDIDIYFIPIGFSVGFSFE